ncbi:MAG: hypothetical protein ABFQ65_01405 [Nanoarchaeota archaeon]
MNIKYKNKNIEVCVKKVSFFGKFIGLMFRTKNTSNLLFDFRKNFILAIHSYFVFFDFLAIWVDENNNVLDFKMVKPFSINVCPKLPFTKLVEIPFNDKNKKIIEFFVGKR